MSPIQAARAKSLPVHRKQHFSIPKQQQGWPCLTLHQWAEFPGDASLHHKCSRCQAEQRPTPAFTAASLPQASGVLTAFMELGHWQQIQCSSPDLSAWDKHRAGHLQKRLVSSFLCPHTQKTLQVPPSPVKTVPTASNTCLVYTQSSTPNMEHEWRNAVSWKRLFLVLQSQTFGC